MLLDEDQFKRHKEIEQTVSRLFDLKKFTFVTYVNELPKDILQSDKYVFLVKNDFNFWGLMKKEKQESLQSEPFDMLIDITHSNDELLTNQYVMSLINNKFRVTFGHDHTSLYDLVIDSLKDVDMLKRIEILHDYLSMLLGKK